MLTTSVLNFDVETTRSKVTDFISKCADVTRAKTAVVAVSGGIDSAVTLAATVAALGRDRVSALTLPERDVTPAQDLEDALRLCESLRVTCDDIEITPFLETFKANVSGFDEENRIAFGNVKARTRMLLTYYHANIRGSIVVGTGNKTELYLGYFTKYGDGGVDILPLGDLYKRQVRELGRHLRVPPSITEKPASARLWPGQLTEYEIGLPYDTLDLIVYAYSRGMGADEIATEVGIESSVSSRIIERIKANEHKRQPPLLLRLS